MFFKIHYTLVIYPFLRPIRLATSKGEIYQKLTYEGLLDKGEHEDVRERSQQLSLAKFKVHTTSHEEDDHKGNL